MNRRFYAEVPFAHLAKIRKEMKEVSDWGGGRCRECGRFLFVQKKNRQEHQDRCHIAAALDILDRHLAPQALKPKLLKSLKQVREKR